MQNVGTWNSDFVIFLFFAMMLPIFISGIAKMIHNLSPSENTIQPSNISPDVVLPDVVRSDDNSMAMIRAELKSIKSKLHSQASQPKPKPKMKPRKKPKSRPRRKSVPREDHRRKTVINSEDKKMMQEVSTALNKLGIKKSRANSIIQDLRKKKTYRSSEDLLQDAIVYV